MEVGQLESLGEIESTTLEKYLKSKFPKREPGIAASSTAIVKLLSGLQSAEIRNYRELDRAIDGKMGWFLDYELKNPLFAPIDWNKPNEARNREYNAIGIVSSILQEILREKHRLQLDQQKKPAR